MSDFWAIFGSAIGVIVAIALLAMAAQLVARARQGNLRVRHARHDPHDAGDDRHPHRDISR